jgi:hypothetical protein
LKVIHGGSNVVASHGVASEANFQIKASAQAFRILSSGLYSDKISAVLREIGCNAADSHVAAGTPDRPIEVKLPTPLDASFYIKDWGIGLTHEEVTGLFTTYFSSNKGESNEMTGAFGLGSKSPFSYTDSFMITVVRDGWKRFYTAHIGSDGSPVITMLGEGEPADADWPSGMMVSFPVQVKDITEFRNKAKKVYRWFRVKPNLLGAEPLTEPKFAIVGSNFRLTAKEDGIGGARVIMGNVAYPLNRDRLGSKDPLVTALVDSNVTVEVPIGAVMPVAAREDLEYDPTTRENLEKALRAVAKEIAETVVKLAQATDLKGWDKQTRLRRYACDLPAAIATRVDQFLELTDLNQQERLDVSAAFRKDVCPLPMWAGLTQRASPLGTYAPKPAVASTDQRFRVHLYRQGEREGTVSRREVVSGQVTRGSAAERAKFLYEETVTLVIGNAPHTHERIKAYVADASKRTVIASVTGATKQQMADLERYAKNLADEMGGLPVIKASELPLPTTVGLKKAKAKGERVKPEQLHAREVVSFWNGSGSICNTKLMKLSEVPADSQFFLVATRRRNPYETSIGGQHCSLSDYDFNRLITAYHELADIGVPVAKITGAVVVSPAKAKALNLAEGGWKSVFATIFEAMTSKAVMKSLRETVSTMPAVDMQGYYYPRSREAFLLWLCREANANTPVWVALNPVLKDHPKLRQIVKDLLATSQPKNRRGMARKAVESLTQQWRALAEPLSKLGLMQLHEVAATVRELYPMIQFMGWDAFQSEATKAPQEAAKFLRMVLRTKSAAAKADTMASLTELYGVQLPLALAS